jgi:DNA-binding transcriptional MerR regulator
MTWTLAELVALASRALEGAEPGTASGRVTGVPDARLVRWYSTIGLVDRPSLGPGRVAYYGPRHLLQLVAVKRLQAQGLALAAVQERLTGSTEAELRRVAMVPAALLAGTTAPPSNSAVEADAGPFWTRRPARAAASRESADLLDRRRNTVTRVYQLQLARRPNESAELVLPAEPGPDDIDDIVAAAQPLLDLLASRGLLDAGQSRPEGV